MFTLYNVRYWAKFFVKAYTCDLLHDVHRLYLCIHRWTNLLSFSKARRVLLEQCIRYNLFERMTTFRDQRAIIPG